jgi:hypothetical protein
MLRKLSLFRVIAFQPQLVDERVGDVGFQLTPA